MRKQTRRTSGPLEPTSAATVESEAKDGNACLLSADSDAAPSTNQLRRVLEQRSALPALRREDSARSRTLKKAQIYCPEVLRGYSADMGALMVVKKNWLEVADEKHR